MNPHFTFNTLNSIQHYITSNRTEDASAYLIKFSKLIRRILEHSEIEFLLIDDEIDTLRLYLDLEKLRFEDQFSYSIEIDEALDTSFERMPSMLIQPFIENAIWHGLMHKDTRDGFIKIKLIDKGEFILCSVEDNGIGREAARKINESKDKFHQSMGLRITKERLQVLAQLYGGKYDIEIVDLKSKNDLPCGTKVIFTFPKT